MERPENNIIAFISKQLKYKLLPLGFLLYICESVFTPKQIEEVKNTVVDAFGKLDYNLPRSTRVNSVREDLLVIFHYLKQHPCSVGQECKYTQTIEKRAFLARLGGIRGAVNNLNRQLAEIDINMPPDQQPQAHSSNEQVNAGDNTGSAQQDDNPPVQPEQVPINPDPNIQDPVELEVPAINQAELPRFNNQLQMPCIDGDEQEQVGSSSIRNQENETPRDEIGVNIPLPNNNFGGNGPSIQLMVSSEQQDGNIAHVSSLRVEIVGSRHVYAPALIPFVGVSTNEGAPERSGAYEPPVVSESLDSNILIYSSADESLSDPVEGLGSNSSASTVSSISPELSDEDNVPLATYCRSITENGSINGRVMRPGRRASRPGAPIARRFEGLPPPSRPIMIPQPIRPRPRAEDRLSDDEALPLDMSPPGPKRRRSVDGE